MTDDRLDEAKCLAWRLHPIEQSDQIKRECFIEGFTLGRESLRAKLDKYRRGELWTEGDIAAAKLEANRLANELEFKVDAERERSRKLMEALERWVCFDRDCPACDQNISGVLCSCWDYLEATSNLRKEFEKFRSETTHDRK